MCEFQRRRQEPLRDVRTTKDSNLSEIFTRFFTVVYLKGSGGAAMSTGSAASDAEDEETRRRKRSAARKGACYAPARRSDGEREDDGSEARMKQERRLSRAQRRDARRSQRNAANARERARMRVLSKAFTRLKTSLPWVPPDTKLSKLDTLRLASSYISHLRQLLQDDRLESRFLRPVSLTWPFMTTGRSEEEFTSSVRLCGTSA